MARTDNEIKVTPSVLDRLLDFEPQVSEEAPKSRSKSLRELKQSVKRDLEWLLNARIYTSEFDENLEEIKKSVLTCGLPDFTGISARNMEDLEGLSGSIEKAIRNFEPRFLNVEIELEPINDNNRILNFKIEAFLDIEPTPEPIVFDTILQLGSGDFEIKQR
jgi:type VI secretion system protein ImpF